MKLQSIESKQRRTRIERSWKINERLQKIAQVVHSTIGREILRPLQHLRLQKRQKKQLKQPTYQKSGPKIGIKEDRTAQQQAGLPKVSSIESRSASETGLEQIGPQADLDRIGQQLRSFTQRL